jgi:hypothetical protein
MSLSKDIPGMSLIKHDNRRLGGSEIVASLLLTSTQMEVSLQFQASAVVPPEKQPPTHYLHYWVSQRF